MSMQIRRLSACTGRKIQFVKLHNTCRYEIGKQSLGKIRFQRCSVSTYANSIARPFRLAIIGSGPAGFYAAGRILEKEENAIVDVYERLPVPFGLVRFGVAPDHPEVKNCQDKFEDTALSPRFRFIGNVDVGKQLPLTVLRQHYDALLFAYGASEDNQLGIPGENLPAVYSARAFVGWYNGLPEYSNLAPRLDNGEEAVIIGQGNVALDVARFLLSEADTLKGTDVTDDALEALKRSNIKHVSIVGRRGPIQAAFTIKEIRELMRLPAVGFDPFDRRLLPEDTKVLPRPRRRIADLLAQNPAGNASKATKTWSLNFLLSPISFNESAESPGELSSVSFARTQFTGASNPFDPSSRVTNTEAIVDLAATHAFRSIGYKSAPLVGLTAELGVNFNTNSGTIPNDAWGRVISTNSNPGNPLVAHVPGMYCAGWVKRGPTGIIASTMEDAFATADAIVKDWKTDAEFINGSRTKRRNDQGAGLGWLGVLSDPSMRNLRPISWEDWKRIDASEKSRGKLKGKPREKARTVEEMLRRLDS